MLARGEQFLRAAVVSDVAVFSISPPLLAAKSGKPSPHEGAQSRGRFAWGKRY
jgi:hypothetical protein